MSALSVIAIDHLVLNVNDIDISFDWYVNILGMHGEKAFRTKPGPTMPTSSQNASPMLKRKI
ncbi:VOC family protein [Bombella saccharophila]|uniref:VOC family protein n=1 Tax=Bombella saccharophila TaxID=2967338 RepID=UPI0038993533